MRRAIATVSMSGTLREKLEAIAAARFDGFELFEPDLINFNGTPAEIGAHRGRPGPQVRPVPAVPRLRGLARRRVQAQSRARRAQVRRHAGASARSSCWCAPTRSPTCCPEEERAAEQLHALAERAAQRNLRIGFEALAWGRKTNLFRQAWSIVERANHPHLGLILDSFHTLSLQGRSLRHRADPGRQDLLPAACRRAAAGHGRAAVGAALPQFSRGRASSISRTFFELVLRAGYTGPMSLEVFNDLFREAPNRRTARRRDALAALPGRPGAQPAGGECRAAAAKRRRRASACSTASTLFDPPAPPVAVGLCLPRVRRRRVVGARARRAAARAGLPLCRQASLEGGDAVPAGRHQPHPERGPELAGAQALRAARPVGVRDRLAHRRSCARASTARPRCIAFPSRADSAPTRRACPRVRAPDGSVVYFVGSDSGADGLFKIDFDLCQRQGRRVGRGPGRHRPRGVRPAAGPARHLGAVLPRRARA